MTRETTRDKALRLLDPKRTRHVKCADRGLVFDVIGDSTDGFEPKPYRVMRYMEAEHIYESCTCPNGQHHPLRPRCSHVELARLIMHVTHGW